MQAAALPSTPVITLTPPTWGLPDICPSLPYILERCQVTFRTEGSRARATHSSWRWPTLQFSPASVTREARPSMPEMTSCRYFGTLPYMPRYLVVMLVCTG